ncbi:MULTISPECIES: hypothetical protein [Burkholderia]|uniref:hypothetical protein n=1 Tax=Burkholderia TaxID=32008 RepID=UPI00158BF709|nr:MULTISPECIES: hypothetical protein [Burkholderia]MBY4867291.1 hypothetical protein [Burkholderia anthina]
MMEERQTEQARQGAAKVEAQRQAEAKPVQQAEVKMREQERAAAKRPVPQRDTGRGISM